MRDGRIAKPACFPEGCRRCAPGRRHARATRRRGKAELAAFRPGSGGPKHYAAIIDAPVPQAPVLTRLHWECFTGDLPGSLKCDCGALLRGAIETIAKAGISSEGNSRRGRFCRARPRSRAKP